MSGEIENVAAPGKPGAVLIRWIVYNGFIENSIIRESKLGNIQWEKIEILLKRKAFQNKYGNGWRKKWDGF